MNTPDQRPTRGSPEPTVQERKALALARLDASRTHIIQRLFPSPEADEHRTDAPSPDLLTTLMDRISRNGLAKGVWRTARAVARRWWTRQPWHTSVDLIGTTLAREARPIVRRHPWASLAAAVALGSALALARPWIVHGLRRQALPWRDRFGQMLWQQLTQTPVQLALAGAITAWLNDLSRRPAAASGARAPAADPSPGEGHGQRTAP
jgi:hypothetical protein